VVTRCKTLQTDGELDVTGPDDILDLEVRELGVETELLDNTGVLARGELRVVLRLGTSDDHLARGEDQSGGLGLTDTHNHGSETLVEKKPSSATLYPDGITGKVWKREIYLRIVLGVASVQRDGLEIQAAVKVDGGNNVPFGRA
jgi:hypothetical protein